jgi:hypothetical protein
LFNERQIDRFGASSVNGSPNNHDLMLAPNLHGKEVQANLQHQHVDVQI